VTLIVSQKSQPQTLRAGFRYGRDRRAQSASQRSDRAPETLGAAQRFNRRFSGDDGPDGRGRASFAAAGQQLIYWEWREDGLNFIGALNDTQIRIRYQAMPADVAGAASSVLMRNGQNTLALLTAALAAGARGSPNAAQWKEQGEEALDAMKDAVVLADARTSAPAQALQFEESNSSVAVSVGENLF